MQELARCGSALFESSRVAQGHGVKGLAFLSEHGSREPTRTSLENQQRETGLSRGQRPAGGFEQPGLFGQRVGGGSLGGVHRV